VVVAELPLQPRVVPQHLPPHRHRLPLHLPGLPQQVDRQLAVVADVDVAPQHRLLPLHSTPNWIRFSPMADTACIH
jgi:hypothetical protein